MSNVRVILIALAGIAACESDGPAGSGAVLALNQDRALTARGFSVVVPVLDNDRGVPENASVVVIDAPRYGTARSDDGRTIEYAPSEGFVGDDAFTYALTSSPLGELGQVVLEVSAREWTLVGDEPFAVLRSVAPDTRADPEPQRWIFSDVSGETIVGYSGPDGAERAFALRLGESNRTWLADAPSRAHHMSPTGVVSGALGPRHASRGALWNGAALEERPTPSWADWAELWAVDDQGVAVGAAGDGDGAFPVRFEPDGRTARLGLPDGFERGLALAVNDVGAIVGAASSAESEVAYRNQDGVVSELPLPDAVWSRASDISHAGTIVGSLRGDGAFARGFVFDETEGLRRFHLLGAIASELNGIGEAGELVGSFMDASGYEGGFVATPDAPALLPGTRVKLAPEAANPAVAHACIHSTEGPFRVLKAATESETPPHFDQPHTSYTLLLAPGARSRFIYRAPAAGNISLFVYPPAALRLQADDGTVLAPQLVRQSSLCPKIAFVYQFEVSSAGDQLIVVDPNPRSTVYMIFERSWAY